MKKNQNNKFGYGIETFLEKKILLFHTSSKFNVLILPSLPLPKRYQLKKTKLCFIQIPNYVI
jgi:hypothetical protein